MPHQFIRSAICHGLDYTTADLIQQWHKEKTPSDDDNINESGSPPKKKRVVSKAKESNVKDSLRRSNKDKTRQKKSVDASSMLAVGNHYSYTIQRCFSSHKCATTRSPAATARA